MKSLVLVPTETERLVLHDGLVSATAGEPIELCGFGVVAAAARTMAALARHRPERVLLVGIAGAIDGHLPLGAARRFGSVACYGIGVGTGVDFSPAGAVGWPQWPGDDGTPTIGDVIPLDVLAADARAAPMLLTACAASACAADVQQRRRLFPAAVAEYLEGFGVALACRLHGVPCAIIRGISNVAGERDKARWATAEAVAAAATLARDFLSES
ncbi:MAG: futalosine hydrolase [Planctomycetia bacterium]